jgi:hypothetical protein
VEIKIVSKSQAKTKKPIIDSAVRFEVRWCAFEQRERDFNMACNPPLCIWCLEPEGKTKNDYR